MKKILTVLLAIAMITTTSTGIFAEENEQEIATGATLADLSGKINLEAIKASSYTVKLPKKVDVSNNSTTFDILAKGDVDASKKIVIVEGNQGQNKLTDQAAVGAKTAVSLTVSFNGGILGKDIQAAYGTAKDTVTITHSDLAAATWKCELPITIKLQDIQAS